MSYRFSNWTGMLVSSSVTTPTELTIGMRIYANILTTLGGHSTIALVKSWSGSLSTESPRVSLDGWGDDVEPYYLDGFVGNRYINYDLVLDQPIVHGNISPYTWNHVVITHKDTDYGYFYLNGIKQSRTRYTISTLGSNKGYLIAGPVTNYIFSGNLSDVCIWHRRLTDEEILLLGKSRSKYIPLQIDQTEMVCYFPMDNVSNNSQITEWKNLKTYNDNLYLPVSGSVSGSIERIYIGNPNEYPWDGYEGISYP